MKKIIGILLIVNLSFYLCFQTYKHLHANKESNVSFSDYSHLLFTEPIQEDIKEYSIDDNNYKIFFIKKYKIAARVLSKENYYFSVNSDVLPVDLALGWNKMSDLSLIEKNEISIKQSNRFYFWRVPHFKYISRSDIEIHSANVHIHPANDEVAKVLKNINKNDIIYIDGYLINVFNKKNNRIFKSSTTRYDTGAGACEILFVNEIKVISI